MNDNHTRVTVKRIEKVPTQFYVQVPQTKTKACTKVKVSVASSLQAEHKRLSRALFFHPPVSTDFSGSRMAFIKKWLAKSRAVAVSGFAALCCRFTENAKRLAFSAGMSVGFAALACVVLVSTCSLGCVITVNGQTVGTVPNAAVYNKLVEEINYEISYVSGEGFAPTAEPEFSTCLIPKGAYSDEADMREQLKAMSQDMLPAYGVYASDQILFALPNEQAALSVLEQYKAGFTEGKENVSAEFCEAVTVAKRFVPKCSLKTAESAADLLAAGRIIIHELAEGETLDAVADAYRVSVDDLLKINGVSDPENPSFRQLKIRTGEPLLSVKTVEFKTIEEEIPFNTIEKEDPAKYEGNIVVEQEGSPGTRVIEAYVTAMNGVETGRKVVSETLLTAAVDQIVQKGTKEPPSPFGTGDLSLPTSGTLSSRFGARWGRTHSGIDFSAPIGTDIYAADNGTVVYSGYNDGGYGNLIQLDHGNGIVTYYGHCSKLLVPEGAVVAKGDLIAKVGNTGRSTGPHLHFEVRINGTPTDPLAYLDGVG